MRIFDVFRKKMAHGVNFGVLHTDMHGHILPGIDDGAPAIKDSLVMARRYKTLGFKKLIATPHIMADYFRNTPYTINKALDLLRNALSQHDVDIEVEAAAEYYLDETFQRKIAAKDLLTFGNKEVLFELSYINMPFNLEETVQRLKSAGYQPVLAHPERYSYMNGDIEKYYRIKELGCAFQLNTISLTGYYGKSMKKAAEELIENDMVDYLGSDMHHMRHADALSNALGLPRVQQLLAENRLGNSRL